MLLLLSNIINISSLLSYVYYWHHSVVILCDNVFWGLSSFVSSIWEVFATCQARQTAADHGNSLCFGLKRQQKSDPLLGFIDVFRMFQLFPFLIVFIFYGSNFAFQYVESYWFQSPILRGHWTQFANGLSSLAIQSFEFFWERFGFCIVRGLVNASRLREVLEARMRIPKRALCNSIVQCWFVCPREQPIPPCRGWRSYMQSHLWMKHGRMVLKIYIYTYIQDHFEINQQAEVSSACLKLGFILHDTDSCCCISLSQTVYLITCFTALMLYLFFKLIHQFINCIVFCTSAAWLTWLETEGTRVTPWTLFWSAPGLTEWQRSR